MKETLLSKYGIKQIGYYVESIEESAKAFADMLGAGPFVDLGSSEPASLLYRGKESSMRSRCAVGQLGNMQIELIEVLTDEPDVYKELGHYGLHHLCIWSDDVDKVVTDFRALDVEPAMEMVSGQGLKVAYLDARELLGSFIEVNAPIDQLWQGVKALAENADENTPPLISMEALAGGRGK